MVRINFSRQIACPPPLLLQVLIFKRFFTTARASKSTGICEAVAPAREYGVGFPYDLDPQISTNRWWFGIIDSHTEKANPDSIY